MKAWKEKVVLVTGGSAGLGRAVATTFASHGARVVIAARGQQAIEATTAELARHGFTALGIPTDVTDQAQVERLIGQTIEQFGRLDVLVNSAGRSARGAIQQTTAADFQALWDLNFLATARCTQAAIPHLLRSSGHVIHIASLAAKVAPRHLGPYPASKHALVAYAQQLRLELGPQGLHVLLVCPGPIARDDAENRYAAQAAGLPEAALKPGGGAKLNQIDPLLLAERIVRACFKRQPELIVPARARLLFMLAQLSPRLGDWMLSKFTSS